MSKKIVTDDNFNKYLEDLKEYSRKVMNGEIAPKESLQNLINAGILNEDGTIAKQYIPKILYMEEM